MKIVAAAARAAATKLTRDTAAALKKAKWDKELKQNMARPKLFNKRIRLGGAPPPPMHGMAERTGSPWDHNGKPQRPAQCLRTT